MSETLRAEDRTEPSLRRVGSRVRSRYAIAGGVALVFVVAVALAIGSTSRSSSTRVDLRRSTPSADDPSASPTSAPGQAATAGGAASPTTTPPTTAETTAVAPSFGTGGGKILFTSPGSPDAQRLSAMYGNGTDRVDVTPPIGPENAHGPQWSPDRRQIALAAGWKGVWVMGPDGSSPRQLTNEFDMFPTWSPDGRFIAVQRLGGDQTMLVVVSAATGEDVASVESGYLGVWSPDSSAVAYIDAQSAGAYDREAHPGDIYLLGLAGLPPTRVTTDAADTDSESTTVSYQLLPWSPSGRVTYLRRAASGAGIYTVERNGLDRVKLSAVGTALDWSRHGLAAISDGARMVILGADGTQVASVESSGRPVWSPNGDTLADLDPHRVVFRRATGGPISTAPVALQGETWSPDGRLLAGISAPTPGAQDGGDLVVASVDGAHAVLARYSGAMCCDIWVDW